MQICDTRFILVRTECPYVQFELSCSCTQFAVGVTNGRLQIVVLSFVWMVITFSTLTSGGVVEQCSPPEQSCRVTAHPVSYRGMGKWSRSHAWVSFDPLVVSRTMELVGRHVAVRVCPARVGRGGAPPPPIARVGRGDTLPRGSDEAEP